MKIAALSDIHVKKSDKGKYIRLFSAASKEADVLLLCGDLTDTGQVEEAQLLAEDAKAATIPVLAVLGNHDYEKEKQEEIKKILLNVQLVVLEQESRKINEVEFFGTKGFCGGFDNFMLASWGEPIIKKFVKEAVNDALQLDSLLSHSQENKKIVMMHYSPIRATVIGESEEIFPFLGSSHYEEVINRRLVSTVFHGHAHRGKHQGLTKTNIPVFNVCNSLLQPDRPYFLYEI